MLRPTFIHRLLIANTVEENIMRFLQNKADSGLRYVYHNKRPIDTIRLYISVYNSHPGAWKRLLAPQFLAGVYMSPILVGLALLGKILRAI